jgi:RecA/RadA recombinase
MTKGKMMSSLIERMKKAGSIKSADTLSESSFFNAKDAIPTSIPALNVALSGKLDGGLTPGLTILAGPSRHFKSMFGLMMIKAYLSKYPDAVCLFMDSEFGITPEYIRAVGIDASRVLHVPIEHIEQLKFDLVKRLEEINRGDKVVIFIDSIGNLASKKEVDDALDEKSAADMTRAKQLKSLFRIITPHFTTKDLPCIVVNHTYQEQALYPKTIMSGGTGPMYSASTVFILGKQQEKEGTDLLGWNFIINIEKSRYVKEKSKIPITVKFEGGVSKWSGLLEMALESKSVVKPSNGWYSRVDETTGEVEDKKWRLKETDCKEFWMPVLQSKSFQEWVKNTYQVSSGVMSTYMELDEEFNDAVAE